MTRAGQQIALDLVEHDQVLEHGHELHLVDRGRQLGLWRGGDRWVRRWNVASTTTPGRAYVVAVDPAGGWGCSCGAWIYDAQRAACKHIRRFRVLTAPRRPQGPVHGRSRVSPPRKAAPAPRRQNVGGAG